MTNHKIWYFHRDYLTKFAHAVSDYSSSTQPVPATCRSVSGRAGWKHLCFHLRLPEDLKMLFHIIITSFDLRICVCAYSVPSCWNETHLTPTSKNLFEIYIYAGDLNCLQQMLKLPLKLILCRLECINPQFDQVWWYVSYSEFDQMRLQDTLDPQNEPFKYQPNFLLRSTLNYL